MAKTFRHIVSDGLVFVNNNATESMYPYSWWITQEAAYTYPATAVILVYTEGGISGQSYYIDTDQNQHALPLDPWPAANVYISKQAVYDIAYADFIGTPTSLSEAKEQKVLQLITKMQEVRTGEVIFGANNFNTTYIAYSRLMEEKEYSDYLTDVPAGYYVNDIADTQVAFTYANLKILVGGIQKLYYECWLNYDIHYAAIQALATIPAVQAYVITTGWPTVPFTP